MATGELAALAIGGWAAAAGLALGWAGDRLLLLLTRRRRMAHQHAKLTARWYVRTEPFRQHTSKGWVEGFGVVLTQVTSAADAPVREIGRVEIGRVACTGEKWPGVLDDLVHIANGRVGVLNGSVDQADASWLASVAARRDRARRALAADKTD
jgi:hypothetical protein